MATERADALFTVPPAGFTAARDALARELRSEDKDAAAAVKAMKRPSAAVWATNQLARRSPDALHDLLAATEAVRHAPDADALRKATRERRDVIQSLTAAALPLLDEIGAAAAQLDRVRATLDAASAESDLAGPLEAGRLEAEPPPATGFDVAALAFAPPARPEAAPAPPRGTDPALQRERDEAAHALEAARAVTGRATDAARRAADEAGRIEAALARARAHAADLERAADEGRAAERQAAERLAGAEARLGAS